MKIYKKWYWFYVFKKADFWGELVAIEEYYTHKTHRKYALLCVIKHIAARTKWLLAVDNFFLTGEASAC